MWKDIDLSYARDVPGDRYLSKAGLVQWPGIMVMGGRRRGLDCTAPALGLGMVPVDAGDGGRPARAVWFGAATFQLPLWVQNSSPFTHIPKAPAAEITAVPVVSLLAVAVALAVAGLVAFRRRNLALPV